MEYPKAIHFKALLWQRNQVFFGEIIFVFVVMMWGITFIFSKNALQVIGPFAYNTIRMTLGAVTLIAMAGRDWPRVNRSYLWPSLLTGLILFGSYATQSYGQQFTTASKAGFLTGTNLVYVPILSALLLRRSPNSTAIAGIVLAFIGLYLVSFEGSLGNLSIAPGDFWVALSGVGWGGYIIVLARYSPYLNVMVYASLHVAIAALITGICWLFLEPLIIPITSLALWVAVITTGFFVIGLGTSIQTWITRAVSPTRIALIAALEPVFAAIAGWWVGESITLRIIIGGVLIMIGILLVELRPLLGRGYRTTGL